jgi:hypothetical protein
VHPRAEEVEQGIGALLPQRLLTLYDDHQTILTEQIEIRRPDTDPEDAAAQKDLAGPELSAEWIEAFLPLDLESQKYTVDLAVFGCGKGFCFATDGAGNFYWTPLSETRQADARSFRLPRSAWQRTSRLLMTNSSLAPDHPRARVGRTA